MTYWPSELAYKEELCLPVVELRNIFAQMMTIRKTFILISSDTGPRPRVLFLKTNLQTKFL